MEFDRPTMVVDSASQGNTNNSNTTIYRNPFLYTRLFVFLRLLGRAEDSWWDGVAGQWIRARVRSMRDEEWISKDSPSSRPSHGT